MTARRTPLLLQKAKTTTTNKITSVISICLRILMSATDQMTAPAILRSFSLLPL